EEDDLRLAPEEAVQAHPPAERGEVRTAGHAHVLAVVDRLAGDRVGERAGAAAEPGAALDQRQAEAAAGQAGRGGGPGGPAADDDDVGGRRLVRAGRHRHPNGSTGRGPAATSRPRTTPRGPSTYDRKTIITFLHLGTDTRARSTS